MRRKRLQLWAFTRLLHWASLDLEEPYWIYPIRRKIETDLKVEQLDAACRKVATAVAKDILKEWKHKNFR